MQLFLGQTWHMQDDATGLGLMELSVDRQVKSIFRFNIKYIRHNATCRRTTALTAPSGAVRRRSDPTC